MRSDMPTFSGGEIGGDLLARNDTAKYRTALLRARNVFLAVGGGVYNRQGLEFAGKAREPGYKVRLIQFQFSVSQGYAIELSYHTLRLVVNGGYVLRRELQITNITNSNPAVVQTNGAHGYEPGWDVIFSGVLGMTQINGKQGRIATVTADSFTVGIDTTTFGAYTGSTGGVPGGLLGGVGGLPPAAPPPPPPTPDAPPPVEPPAVVEPTPPFVDTEPPPPTYNWKYAQRYNDLNTQIE